MSRLSSSRNVQNLLSLLRKAAQQARESLQDIADAITAIEQATGLTVFAFPKEREYFLEMKLEV